MRQIRRIYVTHCSAKKNDQFKNTGVKVTPDKLYTAQPLQRFIRKCKEQNVRWAIFSDKFGLVFPEEKIPWYDKHPGKVTPQEFKILLENFVSKLRGYNEIWFYHNPGRFHKLYKKLINEGRKRGLNIKLFSHLSEIKNE